MGSNPYDHVPGPIENCFCAACTRTLNARAYRRLSPKQRAYDNYVDPLGAYRENFDSQCSCHNSAPCDFCVQQGRHDDD